jgi:hypothetical protein
MRHPEPSTMLCSFTMLPMRGEGFAPLLFRAANHPSSLGWPYGAAEPILRLRGNRVKHFAVRVARLRMARRRSEMDR